MVRSPEGLHHLVILQAAILGLVGVADDHLVDMRLGKLLGLDQVLLAGTQQIVQKRHIEFEHLDELADAAVGDVELAVKVKGPRV